MKTISSPIQHWRGVCLSSVLGCMMLTTGMTVSSTAVAQATESSRTLATGTRLPLATNAPDTYTVKTGDTLWDISQTFLNQPWYWPELWYLNPQVQNPHLIYPGDVLSLVTVDGQPRLMVTERGGEQVVGGNGERLSPQIRSEALDQAISAIPYKSIAAFLGRPNVISRDDVKTAPYVFNLRDNHIVGHSGGEIYARGIDSAAAGTGYNLLHVGKELRDPDTNDLLGYYAGYVGNGTVLASGDPARLRLVETVREVLPGDKLYLESYQMNLDFAPHAPTGTVNGEILAVNGVTLAGKNQVIAINRGTRQGLNAGTVLAIYQAGKKVADRYSDGRSADPMYRGSDTFKEKVRTPDERVGTVMVFKTLERMSYALIMDASVPVGIGDYVRNP